MIKLDFIALLIQLTLARHAAYAYQGVPDTRAVYKKAIKTLNTQIDQPAIIITDDDTFSSKIIHRKPGEPVTLPLSKTVNFNVGPARNARPRKRFGIDKEPTEYWFNNKIHTFGNTGFFGGFHAAVAPLVTGIIDSLAYKGFNVREAVSQELYEQVDKSGARVVDMCCGVGLSTRALEKSFHDAELVVGIDTSPEMIAMARAISGHESGFAKTMTSTKASLIKILGKFPHKGLVKRLFRATSESLAKEDRVSDGIAQFARGHAERTKLPKASIDLVTVMYAFHEIPGLGRYRVLREVRRVLKEGGTLALIDISPEYNPSPQMLAGEPYVLEYKQNIQKQMISTKGFTFRQYKEIVPGHVGMWLLTREKKVPPKSK